MFKRLKAMWERLIGSGNALADTFDEANAKFREQLGLDAPPADVADVNAIPHRNGTARKALAGKDGNSK